MNLLCRLGYHLEGGLISVAGSGKFGARRCHRCHQAVGGIAIDRPKAKVPAVAKSPVWWVTGIYEGKRA